MMKNTSLFLALLLSLFLSSRSQAQLPPQKAHPVFAKKQFISSLSNPSKRFSRSNPKTPFRKTSSSDCLKNENAVELTHYATHETYCLQPIGKNLVLAQSQLQSINHLMRCHITNQEGVINPTLVKLMYQIAHHYPSRKLTIISGYRGQKVAERKGNKNSPHTVGNAADFFIDGVSPKELFDYIRSHYQQISAIYYPNREPQEPNFVHLNPRAKGKPNWFKIDISKPGKGSNSEDPPPLTKKNLPLNP